jgi:hypothetical protein
MLSAVFACVVAPVVYLGQGLRELLEAGKVTPAPSAGPTRWLRSPRPSDSWSRATEVARSSSPCERPLVLQDMRLRRSPVTWATCGERSVQAPKVRNYLEQRRYPTSMQLMAPLGGMERPGRVVRSHLPNSRLQILDRQRQPHEHGGIRPIRVQAYVRWTA